MTLAGAIKVTNKDYELILLAADSSEYESYNETFRTWGAAQRTAEALGAKWVGGDWLIRERNKRRKNG